MNYYNEAIQEWIWTYGAHHPGRAYLLYQFDVWVKNPHYTGPAVPHPESYEA